MAIKKARRSGVALIVVLGLVAILMIVSVTFTIHMRVERAGAANLRHAVIARQVVKGHAVPVPLPVVRSPPLHPRDGDPWGPRSGRSKLSITGRIFSNALFAPTSNI